MRRIFVSDHSRYSTRYTATSLQPIVSGNLMGVHTNDPVPIEKQSLHGNGYVSRCSWLQQTIICKTAELPKFQTLEPVPQNHCSPGVVLAAAAHAQEFPVPSLHPLGIIRCVRGGEHGILARGLLAPAPTGVAENVDVGGPEGEPGAARVEEGARLRAHRLPHRMEQRGVEAGGGGDHLPTKAVASLVGGRSALFREQTDNRSEESKQCP